MLNEPASTIHDRRPHPTVDETQPPPEPANAQLDVVRAAVMQVMAITDERIQDELRPEDIQGGGILLMMQNPKLLARFEGRLTLDSELAYDQLETQFIPLNLTTVFREANGAHHIYVVEGRVNPAPNRWHWNLVLFVLTILSVLYIGADIGIGELQFTSPSIGDAARASYQSSPLGELWRGIPYAVSILLILGAHELGHYFAARRRGIAVTLPYFLPFPLGVFGTFGAFIQLREPMKNRKILFEIGTAGPLVGLLFAIPILAYGLATSPTAPIGPGLIEGDSLLYALAKRFMFGVWVPNDEFDVLLNQMAWAGWTGLFITGLNLLPIGQLDGGHVLYSLVGERAKYVYWPAMGGMIVLSALTGGSLLFMLILLLFFGRVHAVPLDNVTRLDPIRTGLAMFTLLVFVMVFVPVPLYRRFIMFQDPGIGLMAVWLLWNKPWRNVMCRSVR